MYRVRRFPVGMTDKLDKVTLSGFRNDQKLCIKGSVRRLHRVARRAPCRADVVEARRLELLTLTLPA
jgi:hypothetical protein